MDSPHDCNVKEETGYAKPFPANQDLIPPKFEHEYSRSREGFIAHPVKSTIKIHLSLDLKILLSLTLVLSIRVKVAFAYRGMYFIHF